MIHQLKNVVSYRFYENNGEQESIRRTLIYNLVSKMSLEELEKVFHIRILDPRTARPPLNHLNFPDKDWMNKIEQMKVDQIVEYTVTIETEN